MQKCLKLDFERKKNYEWIELLQCNTVNENVLIASIESVWMTKLWRNVKN